jgi:hypothetical protein
MRSAVMWSVVVAFATARPLAVLVLRRSGLSMVAACARRCGVLRPFAAREREGHRREDKGQQPRNEPMTARTRNRDHRGRLPSRCLAREPVMRPRIPRVEGEGLRQGSDEFARPLRAECAVSVRLSSRGRAFPWYKAEVGFVAESADAADLKSAAPPGRPGSSPGEATRAPRRRHERRALARRRARPLRVLA